MWIIKHHSDNGEYATLMGSFANSHDAIQYVRGSLHEAGYRVGLVAKEGQTVFVVMGVPRYIPVGQDGNAIGYTYDDLDNLIDYMFDMGYEEDRDGITYQGDLVYSVPFTRVSDDDDADDEEDEDPEPRTKVASKQPKADTKKPAKGFRPKARPVSDSTLISFLNKEGPKIKKGWETDDRFCLLWSGIKELTGSGTSYREALASLRERVLEEGTIPRYLAAHVLAWALENRLRIGVTQHQDKKWSVSYFESDRDRVPKFMTQKHVLQTAAVAEAMFRSGFDPKASSTIDDDEEF